MHAGQAGAFCGVGADCTSNVVRGVQPVPPFLHAGRWVMTGELWCCLQADCAKRYLAGIPAEGHEVNCACTMMQTNSRAQKGDKTSIVARREHHKEIVAIVGRLIAGISQKGANALIDVADIAQRESFDVIGKVGALLNRLLPFPPTCHHGPLGFQCNMPCFVGGSPWRLAAWGQVPVVPVGLTPSTGLCSAGAIAMQGARGP